MKKILILLAASTALSAGLAVAANEGTYGNYLTESQKTITPTVPLTSNELTINLTGIFDFQGGIKHQSKLTDKQKFVSTNRKNSALNSVAFVGAKIAAESDDLGITYGANLGLYAQTQSTGSSGVNRSYLFMEGTFGKIELGSNFDAGTKMRLTFTDIARATGGDWSDYATLKSGDAIALSVPSFFLDNTNARKGESSRKITYFSPSLNGFRFGLSYIPDSGNLGSGPFNDATDEYNQGKTTNVNQRLFSERKAVKDAVSLGMSYDFDISCCTKLKVALTTEHGSPAQKAVIRANNQPDIEYKLDKLATYNIGAVLTMGNYAFAASYADLGKSLTAKEFLGKDRKTQLYTIGTTYTQGPVGVSLGYTQANQAKNKTGAYTLATDYKLAPGFMPYAEITYFNSKAAAPYAYQANSPVKKLKGTIFILGARVQL